MPLEYGVQWAGFERGRAGTNAGIIRELLRYARVQEGRDPGYAVTWPDHPPAVAAVTSRRSGAKPAWRG
jgi:hypothetical protein